MSAESATPPTDTPAAPAAAGASSWGALPRRLAVGFSTSLLVLLCVYLDWKMGLDLTFHLFFLGVNIIVLMEFYGMCGARGSTPFRKFGMTMGGTLVILHWLSMPGVIEKLLSWSSAAPSDEWLASNLAVLRDSLVPGGIMAAIFGVFFLQAHKRDNDRPFESIFLTLGALLYVWFTASFMIKIRHIGDGGLGGGLIAYADWNTLGTWFMIQMICVTKVFDVGAYFAGRRFGKHKMIRRISPGKTWEGAVGGGIVSIATALGFQHFQLGELTEGAYTPLMAVVFGLVVGAVGQSGDLGESLLKRGSGLKDAGKVLPGYGGVMDLVDSLLTAAPVAYLLYFLMLGNFR